MTTEEKLDRLTDIVNALPSTVAAHDNQIGALIEIAEKHEKTWQDLQRQWQAYINTLPRQ